MLPVQELEGRWRQGPDFLCQPESEWPVDKSHQDMTEEITELKVKQVLTVTRKDIIESTKFSTWKRLLRVTAYVLRFVQILKSKIRINQKDFDKSEGTLTPIEIEKAENFWIKKAQDGLHSRMMKGEFKTLSPYIDKEGIIRVGGRTDKYETSFETKHPVLLPYKHWISFLVTRQVHEEAHTGIASTVAKTRRYYWIIKVHKLAKTIKFRCVVCRAFEHKTETQEMATLPKEHVKPFTPPFHFTACDYFGPFQVKVGHNETQKYYGVIFTCLNTRAVHLELAVDYSSMEFLQVLRRFFAIRGKPVTIISDNGSQFIGAERELKEMIKGWSIDELKNFCADKGTEWKFVTPAAPHQNGCAEALVKSCKYGLKKTIGEQTLTPFELYTWYRR